MSASHPQGTNPSPGFVAFEIEIESEIEVQSFSRILATVVNGSPVHLERVVVAGTVVHPVLSSSLYEPRTVRRCRFAVRRTGGTIDRLTVTAVLTRIGEQFEWSSLQLLRGLDGRPDVDLDARLDVVLDVDGARVAEERLAS